MIPYELNRVTVIYERWTAIPSLSANLRELVFALPQTALWPLQSPTENRVKIIVMPMLLTPLLSSKSIDDGSGNDAMKRIGRSVCLVLWMTRRNANQMDKPLKVRSG